MGRNGYNQVEDYSVSFVLLFNCTRVVPKVPLHALFFHSNSTSDLTTIMVIKYYILGLFG